MQIKQAFILCGGLGKRLGSLVKDIPKPMLPIAGKPILEHTVEQLKKYGIKEIILGAGYKAQVVEEFFSNLDWGLKVDISVEKERLGTSGALKLIENKLDDTFLVIYGDVFIDFDISEMIKKHKKENALVTILVGPSTHPWDSDLIQVKDDIVTEFVWEHNPKRNYWNLGNKAVYIMSKRILDYIPKDKKSDFMHDIFPKALNAGEKISVHHLEPSGFVRDMGKAERFPIVEKYLQDRARISEARKNREKITTVFLDRDGVLNKDLGHIHTVKSIEMLDGVPEAIKLFTDNDIKCIVVTNQPAVARGFCDKETNQNIQDHVKRLVESKGGKLVAMYCCIHHPETQYGEGVEELRRGCDCRKPSNGMLMQAKDDLSIDLKGAVMIGDSFRDIEAGKNSGLRTIFIDSGKGAIKENMNPDYTFKSLLEATKSIVEGKI
jgi:mannose-1-phosphate guanylyltransferase / phosphomannomutase